MCSLVGILVYLGESLVNKRAANIFILLIVAWSQVGLLKNKIWGILPTMPHVPGCPCSVPVCPWYVPGCPWFDPDSPWCDPLMSLVCLISLLPLVSIIYPGYFYRLMSPICQPYSTCLFVYQIYIHGHNYRKLLKTIILKKYIRKNFCSQVIFVCSLWAKLKFKSWLDTHVEEINVDILIEGPQTDNGFESYIDKEIKASTGKGFKFK